MNEEICHYDIIFFISGPYVLFKRKFRNFFLFSFFGLCKRTVTLFQRAFEEL